MNKSLHNDNTHYYNHDLIICLALFDLLGQYGEAVSIPGDVRGQVRAHVLQVEHQCVSIGLLFVNHIVEFIGIAFYRYQP